MRIHRLNKNIIQHWYLLHQQLAKAHIYKVYTQTMVLAAAMSDCRSFKGLKEANTMDMILGKY